MNPIAGWTLAAVALFLGWRGWGWQGVVLALTVIAFWLILQFNRALRVLRSAGSSPMGHIDSAVMLNAKLRRGMPLWQVVSMTKSLGRPTDGGGLAWHDPGGAQIEVSLRRGRLARWQLLRPPGQT